MVRPRSATMAEVALVALLSAVVLAVLRSYSVDIAGGSDSYGYVSEAIRLAHGHLYESEHVFAQFGLPENPQLTYPLGYRPFGSQGLVPTYPFGYPLLMAIALRIFGLAGAFWVAPVLGMGAVLATYLTGRQLLGRVGGVFAALLVAILPNFVWGAVQPMSDVPATFFAILALYALLSPNRSIGSLLLLATSEGLAIWIRPNMALLTVPTALWFVGHRDWKRLVTFGLLLFPFIVVEGATNSYLYGAPWATGYGSPPMTHSLSDAAQRGIRYLGRLQDQQAGVGLALVALGLTFGRLPLRIRALLFGVAAIIFIFFSFYTIDDAWWYARFLLPGFPAVAILEASILVRVCEDRRFLAARWTLLGIGVALFAYGSIHYSDTHDVLDQAYGARSFVNGAELARTHVQQPALILTMEQSGSLRLYSGLPSARYDLATLPQLLATIGTVRSAGGHIYLLAYKWEVEDIQKGNRSILLAGAQPVGQVEPGPVLLYRLDPPLAAGDQKPEHPMDLTFSNPTGVPISLDGYDVVPTALNPGSPLTVTLYWQASGNVRDDYSVFIHVVDQSGKIVAQSDSFPENNHYPTSKWTAGYVVVDSHEILLPATARPGTYQIFAGLYQYQTLRRLQPGDHRGPLKTDYVSLGQVRIAPEN